jgi:hypothetical protein
VNLAVCCTVAPLVSQLSRPVVLATPGWASPQFPPRGQLARSRRAIHYAVRGAPGLSMRLAPTGSQVQHGNTGVD